MASYVRFIILRISTIIDIPRGISKNNENRIVGRFSWIWLLIRERICVRVLSVRACVSLNCIFFSAYSVAFLYMQYKLSIIRRFSWLWKNRHWSTPNKLMVASFCGDTNRLGDRWGETRHFTFWRFRISIECKRHWHRARRNPSALPAYRFHWCLRL